VVGAASTGLLSVVLTGALLPAFATGAAVSVVIAATTLSADGRTPDVAADRRRILGGVASAVTVTLAGFLLGSGRDSDTTVAPLEVDRSLESETESLLGTAETQSLDVAGLEPLVSDSFYEVDINSVNPDRSADSWELSVTGAVEEERTYTYDDVTSMDAENQFVSLRCVGEGLNGRKLDNALWQGVPIMDLVEPAVPTEGCCVMLRAADGFYEEFPLSALEDGFLAFGMNGEALPAGTATRRAP